jgi:hypothetical protein
MEWLYGSLENVAYDILRPSRQNHCAVFYAFGCRGLSASGHQGRGVHVTGVSAAYNFKLNKNILSE